MPTPFPDPFSGAAEGLQRGFSMGIAAQDQKRRTEAQEFQNDLETIASVGKLIETSQKVGATNHTKELIKMQTDVLNRINKRLGIDRQITFDGNIDDTTTDYLKNTQKAVDELLKGNIPPSEFGGIFKDIYSNAQKKPKTEADQIIESMSGAVNSALQAPTGTVGGATLPSSDPMNYAALSAITGKGPNPLAVPGMTGAARKQLEGSLSQMDPKFMAQVYQPQQDKQALGLAQAEYSRMKGIPGANPEMLNDLASFIGGLGGDSAIRGMESHEYRTREPRHKGQSSGEPYVWDSNALNAQTGRKGDYVNIFSGKPLSTSPEPLIPLESGRTPPAQLKEANFNKSAMQRLQNIAKYYKPEYVGIIQGRIANVERKLKDLPPEQVKFYREFKQLNDDIIRAKEGAVVPDAMMKRLEQFMNDIKQPEGNFEAQFDSLTDYVRDQGMNLDESLKAGTYVSPFQRPHRDFWGNRESLIKKRPTKTKGDIPKTYGEVFKAIKANSTDVTDAEIDAYIKQKYPNLKK